MKIPVLPLLVGFPELRAFFLAFMRNLLKFKKYKNRKFIYFIYLFYICHIE